MNTWAQKHAFWKLGQINIRTNVTIPKRDRTRPKRSTGQPVECVKYTAGSSKNAKNCESSNLLEKKQLQKKGAKK